MEFLELLKSIQSFIPPEFGDIAKTIELILPYVFIAISLLMCFMGYKLHKIWLTFLFFFIGFFLGALSGVFFPATWSIYIFIALGVVLGVLAAIFSHKIYHVQLFMMNAGLVYSVLPSLLGHIMPETPAILVSLVFSIAFGVLAVKFKYIVTIVTTAVTGAINVAPILLHVMGVDIQGNPLPSLGIMLSLGLAGLTVQFLLERRGKTSGKEDKKPEPAAAQLTEVPK